MSKDGILVTILNLDKKTHQLLIKPNITTRGFVMVNDNKALIQDIENKVSEITNNAVKNKTNITDLKNMIILELSMYINKLTGRRPMVLPVVMEVEKLKND